MLAALWAFFTTSCVGLNLAPNKAPPPHEELSYWLTTSMYAGSFYDNKKVALFDHRPFSAIKDVTTPDGKDISPPKESKVVPAGTLVRVMRIDYPDTATKFRRPLYSPRHNVWVYCQVAKERGRVSIFESEPYIMVLPSFVTNEAEVREYLKQFLSTTDPNPWLLTQRKYVQTAIWSKQPAIGMTERHLLAALGPALHRTNKSTKTINTQVWEYPDYLVTLEDNEVARVTALRN